MSLREKILILLLCMLCCYAGLEFFVLKNVVAPELTKHEEQQAKQDLYRCVKAFESDLNESQQTVSKRAKSGQLYPTVQAASNELLETLAVELAADFLIVYDINWNIISQNLNQLEEDTIKAVVFQPNRPFLKKDNPGVLRKALIYHQNNLYHVVSAPITQSYWSKTIEGTVVAGRVISEQRFAELRKQLHLGFSWDLINPDRILGQNKEIIDRTNDENPYDVIELGEEYLQVSTVLHDHHNKPVLILKMFKDRTISQQSIRAMQMALYTKIIIGTIAVLILTLLLQCVVVKPIIQLIKNIVSVGNPCAADDRISLSSRNEIGTLANEFDQMCQRLQQAQVKLMEKSYLSGVTEMSSGILHNVRNALSPITTRIERIKDQFKGIPLNHLEQAQSELQDGRLDPERRKDLLRFVDLTFQDVLENLNDMVAGLDDLSHQVFEIEDMLNLQRTFGREDKPVEFIEPQTLLNKAMEIIPERVRSQCRISIHPKIKKLLAVPVEPTTFIQILQNLLINASESLEREKPLYPKIHVEAQIQNIEGQKMLHWQIQDNGSGISEESIQKIFERGASSKRKGLTGIGLHWCANTITAMKGRIWAESQGLHRGATFHILMPITVEVESSKVINKVTNES